MNNEEFVRVLQQQIRMCEDMLVDKAREYADDDDRLHNFKVSASMTGETPMQALAGMMVKHTTSIYDMIRLDQDYGINAWNEKITDHINYLILLRALVCEQYLDAAQEMLDFNTVPDHAPKHI